MTARRSEREDVPIVQVRWFAKKRRGRKGGKQRKMSCVVRRREKRHSESFRRSTEKKLAPLFLFFSRSSKQRRGRRGRLDFLLCSARLWAAVTSVHRLVQKSDRAEKKTVRERGTESLTLIDQMAVVAAAAASAARRGLLSSAAAAARFSSLPLAAAGSRACFEHLINSSSRIAAVPSCSYAVQESSRRFSSTSSAPASFASSSSSSSAAVAEPKTLPSLSAPLVDPSTGQRIPGASFPLPADIFGLPSRPDILHRVVVWQLAKKRQGTGAAKNRAAVSGGGRKPWKQKGTGRARAGSIRSPLWVGGGKAHPPVPRSFETKCNKKVRRLALATALSARAAEGRLFVVSSGGGDGGGGGTSPPPSSASASASLASDGKTATLAKALAAMLPAGARPSALLADGGGDWFEKEEEEVEGDEENREAGGGGKNALRDKGAPPPPSVAAATALRRAASALPLVEVLSPVGLQPLSILRADFLVMTPEAVEAAAKRVRAQVKR